MWFGEKRRTVQLVIAVDLRILQSLIFDALGLWIRKLLLSPADSTDWRNTIMTNTERLDTAICLYFPQQGDGSCLLPWLNSGSAEFRSISLLRTTSSCLGEMTRAVQTYGYVHRDSWS